MICKKIEGGWNWKKNLKLFPIKQTPIKRIGTKSDEKTNWRAVWEFKGLCVKIKEERGKKNTIDFQPKFCPPHVS